MMIMVLYGAIWGKTRFDVKQVTFTSPNLPAAFDGYRIAQISDIHTGSWNGDRAALQKAVDRINAQQTDLIVFTVTSSTRKPRNWNHSKTFWHN